MHRHITYYTQSTVCQSGFYERISSDIFLSSSPWASAGFAMGGQLFGVLGELHAAKLGFGGMLPREHFFLNDAIWCVLEHIFINF